MNKEKVKACKTLCKQFLERVKEWEEATVPYTSKWGNEEYTHVPSAPKQSGALRRVSMELTRALSDMRKAN